MAKDAKESKDKKAVTEAPPPKSSKKLVLILAAVVVLAGAGVGAWLFLKDKRSSEEIKAADALAAQPIYTTLEPFTVNLMREQSDQVLQVGISLKFYNKDLEEKIKNDTPEIRSNLLLLLSGKRPSELATSSGKTRLMTEIVLAVNKVLGKPTKTAAVPGVAVSTAGVQDRTSTPSPAAPAAETTATAGAAPSLAAAPPPAASASPPAPAVAGAAGGLATALVAGGEGTVAPSNAAPPHQLPPLPDLLDDKSAEGVVGVLFTSFIVQ